MRTFQRLVCRLLAVCVLGAGAPLPAGAALVETGRALQGASRTEVAGFLEREEVRARLQALGVDPAAARDRVAALSDEEAASLAERIAELPAAGADLIGALLFVFIVLLVTDILGFTKVFPFTRPVR